jgi:ATP-dependent HslUV protease ATP-binding subunit HslU
MLGEISFAAPELSDQKMEIDSDYIRKQLADIIEDRDLSRYIL